MKVMLVIPVHGYTASRLLPLSISDFPTGFAYVAAALKRAGHTVVGVNPNNDTRFDSAVYMLANKLSTAINEHKPDLIGVGGICTDYASVRDTIDFCRKFAPQTPIVMGGGIISNDREFIFENLKPTYGLIGEAEETLVELANGHPPSSIANLSWWKDGKAVHNHVDHNYPCSLDERAFPDYEVFGGLEMVNDFSMATRQLYRYTRTEPRPFVLLASRSCPFSCSFCVHRGGAKYRARSIPNIMQEIKAMYEQYQFNILVVLDELFAVNKQRMKEFCEELLRNKEQYHWDFDWSFQTHASAALDLDSLKLAKRAGCNMFSYGLESASPRVLESMNKRTKPAQIIEAIGLAKQAGIAFSGNLIFGDPAETPDTIRESLEFYYQHCQSAFVFLSHLQPYPGNKLFDYCVEKGIIKDKADYYANIHKRIYNMTAMPDQTFTTWLNYFQITEQGWFQHVSTVATRIRPEGPTDNKMAKLLDGEFATIDVVCPVCGANIQYREIAQRHILPNMIGTGCTKCNHRIKVYVAGAPIQRTPEPIKQKELVAA